MLYTRKGDGGTTKVYGCDQRISKSSAVAEALGSLDEINSFLGLVKVASAQAKYSLEIDGVIRSFESVVHGIQENLFSVQAEVAGFPKKIGKEKVTEAEALVDSAEKQLPPIKTFFISGGTELAALFDVARTLARRAERRVVSVAEASVAIEGDKVKSSEEGQNGSVSRDIGPDTLAYLNRLSSVLYALARLSNHMAGIKETPPSYT
jgi:cob(I)alamin adenosyltransferase